MEKNENIENLMYAFGVHQDEIMGEINSYNRYLGKLYEFKFELEDALDECIREINKIQKERKPF